MTDTPKPGDKKPSAPPVEVKPPPPDPTIINKIELNDEPPKHGKR